MLRGMISCLLQCHNIDCVTSDADTSIESAAHDIPRRLEDEPIYKGNTYTFSVPEGVTTVTGHISHPRLPLTATRQPSRYPLLNPAPAVSPPLPPRYASTPPPPPRD